MKTLAQNKKAYMNYEIMDSWEAGISLLGAEVKSIKDGNVSIDNAYVTISKDNSIFLINMHVDEYKESFEKFELTRSRRLLLNKLEINRIASRIMKDKLVCVPLKVYINNRGLIKLQIALARSLKKQDKRELEKERDFIRDKKKYI